MNYRLHAVIVACALCFACATSEPEEPRAARRSYDGAPPVIGHKLFRTDCRACHARQAIEVNDGYGWSPAMPHGNDGSFKPCRLCHVTARTDEVFRVNLFQPLEQDLRSGSRARAGAPPVMPHRLFMRENCLACHDGPGSREEFRTTHPERENCMQCHVQQQVADEWMPTTLAAR